MPRFDGTGPLGSGPLTGRGMGPCMGWRRRGGGYGYGSWRMTRKEETEALKDEAEILEEELKEIKERLTELRGKK